LTELILSVKLTGRSSDGGSKGSCNRGSDGGSDRCGDGSSEGGSDGVKNWGSYSSRNRGGADKMRLRGKPQMIRYQGWLLGT